MKTLIVLAIITFIYSFAWYTGYLIEQSNYPLAAFNAITVIMLLYALFNTIKED